MPWFLIPSIIIASVYAIMMICFLLGWNKLKNSNNKSNSTNSLRLSVLIALRNEESNIPSLIQSLVKQDFPQENLEILMVDDHSSDNTLKNLRNTTSKLPHFHILSLPNGQQGKKAALRFGHAHSSGDIIVITDGDCQHRPEWLNTMANAFSDKKTGMVIGPVVLLPASSGFHKLIQLEYLSLVASAAGSTGISRPILAFGPNMAVRNTLYTKLIKEIKDQIASGDDMFILEAAKRNADIDIKFVLDKGAIVSSPPPSNFFKFWNQRKRWISKSGNYTDKDVIFVSISVYLMNLSILISLILALLSMSSWWFFILLLVSKAFFEYPLMKAGGRFFNLKGVFKRFLLSQVLYIFYIIFILPTGMLITYKWKNRVKI